MTPLPDRQLGAELRRYRLGGRPGGTAMASVVRDLLGAEEGLMAPLLHLVQRPAFQVLDPAGSIALRILGRDALLREVEETYHPRLLDRLRLVLDGYLDLWDQPPAADGDLQATELVEPAAPAPASTQPPPPAGARAPEASSVGMPDPWMAGSAARPPAAAPPGLTAARPPVPSAPAQAPAPPAAPAPARPPAPPAPPSQSASPASPAPSAAAMSASAPIPPSASIPAASAPGPAPSSSPAGTVSASASSRPPAGTATPAAAKGIEPEVPDGESGVPESPPRSLAPLLRAGALTLLVALLAGVAVRTPLLCRPLGLCAAVPSGGARESSPSEKALKAGEAALKTMRSVGSLGAYQKALADLDNQLLRLSGDSLDADQQARRQRLQEASREGQARLKQERSQADVVSQAAERIDGMAGQPGGAAESDRSEIRRSLESVPAQSFSHGEARTQLRRLEAAPAATAPPEPEAPAAESPAPPAAPEAAPAPPPAPAPRYEGGGGGWQRGSGGGGWSGGGSGGGGGGGWSGGSRSAPAPAPAPAPPADAGGSDAPYRDEPLF